MLVAPVGFASSTTSNSSLVCTTSLASPAGNTIVFALGFINAAVTATAVDSAGNTYTGVLTSSGTTFSYLFYCVGALALPAGGTITVTFSSNVTNKSMSVCSASGIIGVDIVGGGAVGSSTAPAYTTSTLTQNAEIVFAATTVNAGQTTSYAESSGWTSNPRATSENALTSRLSSQIVNNGATVAPSYSPTLGSSLGWATNIVTFLAGGQFPKTVTMSGTSWTVPKDWNSADNLIECVSGGGNGFTGAAASGGGGGGAGGYAAKNNVSLTPGNSIQLQIGIGGGTTGVSGTGASWFNGTAINAASVGIAGAANATTTSGSPGAVITNATGFAIAGGTAGNGGSSLGGGGGGGPAGRTGSSVLTAGVAGTATLGGTGRPGDGLGGAGGTTSGPASPGSGPSGNNLSGGGGGGGSLTAGDTAGKAGGAAGGGGGGGFNAGTGGAGQPGVIVVTYTPILPFNANVIDHQVYSAPQEDRGSESGFTLLARNRATQHFSVSGLDVEIVSPKQEDFGSESGFTPGIRALATRPPFSISADNPIVWNYTPDRGSEGNFTTYTRQSSVRPPFSVSVDNPEPPYRPKEGAVSLRNLALVPPPVVFNFFGQNIPNPEPFYRPKEGYENWSRAIRSIPVPVPHFTVAVDNPIFYNSPEFYHIRDGRASSLPLALLVPIITPTIPTNLRQAWSFG